MFGGDIDKLIPKINEIPPQNPWFSIGSYWSYLHGGPYWGVLYSIYFNIKGMGLYRFFPKWAPESPMLLNIIFLHPHRVGYTPCLDKLISLGASPS
jgi:hypothetical protein